MFHKDTQVRTQTLLPRTGFRAAASLCPCKASCSYCMCAHPSS